MKTLFKIIILTAFIMFIAAKCYQTYDHIKAWVERPSEEQIKAQYKRVGY